MPGRHKREPTENEKEHDYVRFEKREHGEKLQGALGGDLDEKGDVGEVRARRMAWKEEHED